MGKRSRWSACVALYTAVDDWLALASRNCVGGSSFLPPGFRPNLIALKLSNRTHLRTGLPPSPQVRYFLLLSARVAAMRLAGAHSPLATGGLGAQRGSSRWRGLPQHPERNSQYCDDLFPQLSTDQIWQDRQLHAHSQLRVRVSAVSATVGCGSPVNFRATSVNGKIVFESKGACLTCHQFNGNGIAVGPDLTSSTLTHGRSDHCPPRSRIQNRFPRRPVRAGPGVAGAAVYVGAVEAVMSAARATVTATTADGKVYKGTRKSQDSFTIQIVDTTGAFRSFDRAELKDLKIDAISLMPADYATRLTANEIPATLPPI